MSGARMEARQAAQARREPAARTQRAGEAPQVGHAPAARALWRSLRAEWSKSVGLPGVWVGAALSVAVPTGLEALNTRGLAARAAAGEADALAFVPQLGFVHLIYGAVGAVVLATVLMASEYTALPQESGGCRQVSTTMLLQPRRGSALAAKILVVQAWVTLCAAAASAATLAVSVAAMGRFAPDLDPLPWDRFAGVLAWWSVAALGALMLAALTRGSLVPLVWCITTTSLVSPSLLLWQATRSTAVAWLPDSAGPALIMGDAYKSARFEMPDATAWQCALACALWWGVFVVVSAAVWVRRDA